MSNKAVSNIRWEEFSDAELLDMARQLIALVSERFEIRAREIVELTGELNDRNPRHI